jgi:hypothetical protein
VDYTYNERENDRQEAFTNNRELFFRTLPFEQHLQGVKVQGLTEYTRQQVTFRCHPNYRNEGQGYDHAMLAWEQFLNSKDAKVSS